MASSRSIMIQLRARPREVKLWRTAAKRADETLSEWIRSMCNTGAVPAPPAVPPTITGDQIELPFSKTRKKKSS